jgi:hypothetical protein
MTFSEHLLSILACDGRASGFPPLTVEKQDYALLTLDS